MNPSEAVRNLTCQLQALLRDLAARHHLSPTQAQILFSVPVDGLAISALSHRLGLDISTVSRIVDKMSELGFVRKENDLEDRRVNRVILTEQGRAMYRQLNGDYDTEVQTVLAGLDMEDKEDMVTHMEELTWRIMRQRQ